MRSLVRSWQWHKWPHTSRYSTAGKAGIGGRTPQQQNVQEGGGAKTLPFCCQCRPGIRRGGVPGVCLDPI